MTMTIADDTQWRRSDEHVGGADFDPRRADVARPPGRQLARRRRHQSSVGRRHGDAGGRATRPSRRHHPPHGRRRAVGRVARDGRHRQLAAGAQLAQRDRLRQSVGRRGIARTSTLRQLVYSFFKFFSLFLQLN